MISRLTTLTRRVGPLIGLPWLLVVSCSDPVAPITPADVTGTYALFTLNGQSLPAPFGTGTTIVYDSLSLIADSTWVLKEGSGHVGNTVADVRETYRGRWILDAKAGLVQRTFVSTANGHTERIVDSLAVGSRGQTLTFSGGSGVWVYQRTP